ncbi:hypothetical protein PAMP_005014 [Pampus punctatissimus]
MAGEYDGAGRGGSSSLGSLIGWLCLAFSPAAPSAWFVCGGLTVLGHIKGPAWFFALFFMNGLLFLVHPPGASQQKTPFQTNSRQMQTLHSIMTSGEHSNGIAPVGELNLER